jgi:hypothetical protein
MIPSETLFYLIHSLDKTEKIHFKRYVGRGDKLYLWLFDFIKKQKLYDEEKVKARFKNNSIAKRLPAVKNYLYHLVLYSLLDLYSDKNSYNYCDELISKSKILIHKGMNKEALKFLAKAQAIATENEFFLHLLDTLALVKKIYRSLVNTTNDNRLLKIRLLEDDYLRKYDELSQYLNLDNEIFIYRKSIVVPRNAVERNIITRKLKNRLLKRKIPPQSFETKFIYFRLNGICHSLLGNESKSLHYRKLQINLFDNSLVNSPERLHKYSGALYEYATSLISQKNYDEALKQAQKIFLIADKYKTLSNEKSRSIFFKRGVIIETDVYISSANFEKGISRVKYIQAELKKFGDKIDKDLEMIIHYNISILYFLSGDYKKSLLWLNKIINDNDESFALDLQCFSRIINLILHIEIGNHELMEYIGKSTLRYLEKRKRLYRAEHLILKFIKQYFSPKTNSVELVYKAMLKEFEILAKDNFEKTAFNYFDFISWIESKITGTTMAYIIKQKPLQH